MNYADKYLKLAYKLITKYGRSDAIYKKITKNDIDGSIIDEQSVPVKIVILPSAKYSKETLKFRDGVSDSDYLAFLFPVKDLDVSLNDIIESGGETFTIKSSVKLYPNGTTIIYKLELK